MLKVDRQELAEMDRSHPGVWNAIRHFEANVFPPCPLCRSHDTAVVEIAHAGMEGYLAAASTKMRLIGRGPKPGEYYCNTCGQYFG